MRAHLRPARLGRRGRLDQPEQYETIQLADVDGDGDDELLGRTPAGLAIHDFDKTLGQWRPQVDAQGLPVVLRAFANPPPLTTANPTPPATDWTLPQYYDTIQAADIDGQRGEEIIARSSAGMIVFKYASGSWRQLTTSGPLADSSGWGKSPSYYATIQTGQIDGRPGADLIARGGQGVVVLRWNGGGWTLIVDSRLYPDPAYQDPQFYSVMQVADVTGDGKQELIVRDDSGLLALAVQNGKLVSLNRGNGPFAQVTGLPDCPMSGRTGPCFGAAPAYYGTIQLADVDGDRRAEALGRAGDGLRVRNHTGGTSWPGLPGLSDLSDANGWGTQARWETIQAADINGDGRAEVLARGGDGLHAWSYDPLGAKWAQLAPSTPLALADDPWGSDRSYYSTIQTGDVNGDGRADVIARGPYGIRTWFYNRRGTGGWESYLPSGYPAFAGAGQAAAFAELNARAMNQGVIPASAATVRDVWAAENAPAPTDLTTLQQQLLTIGACNTLTSQVPPQYASCTPPAGAVGFSGADWTAVMNEVFAELFWAQQAVAHFADLQGLRQTLFIEQGAQLPVLGKDLQLAGAAGVSTEFDPKEIFGGVLGIAGAIAGEAAPEVGVPLEIVAELMSMIPSSSQTLTDRFQGTYADLQARFANSIAETDKAMAEHSQLVRQDAAMLTLVGQLRSRGTWSLDKVGMASAARQGFTLSVYRTLLPTIWARYSITSCHVDAWRGVYCYGPSGGPWLQGGGDSFTLIAPSPTDNTPCVHDVPIGPGTSTWNCQFVAPPADAAGTLWGQVSPTCAYQPGNAATAWTFGCALGVDPTVTFAPASTQSATRGWPFPDVSGDPMMGSGLAGTAVVRRRNAVFRLKGTIPLPRKVRLDRARVVHSRLAYEGGRAGELVRRESGRRLGRIQLSRRPRGDGVRRLFASRTRRGPVARLRLSRAPRRSLRFALELRNVRLALPAACAGTRPGVDLATGPVQLRHRLRIHDGGRRPVPIAIRANWRCRRDRRGAVRRLVLEPPRIRKPRRAALAVAVRGPRVVRAGRRTTLRMELANRRRALASGVTVRTILPAALARNRARLWRVRALRPGRSRVLRLRLRPPRSATGRTCATIVTTAIDTRETRRRVCLRVRPRAG